MSHQSRINIIPSNFCQRILPCLILILLGIFVCGKTICFAEEKDWEDKKYLQSLPDKSFSVVEKRPDGTIIRLLPHHDSQGNLIIPKLEESLNRVFELDLKYQEQARDHLLADYYEYKPEVNADK
ncbi:MAG: hypothetical protein JXA79_03870 [Deltaproteobacteria bacterium]|nr:hypothetical protein [Deltaproteobacteria bacterium]